MRFFVIIFMIVLFLAAVLSGTAVGSYCHLQPQGPSTSLCGHLTNITVRLFSPHEPNRREGIIIVYRNGIPVDDGTRLAFPSDRFPFSADPLIALLQDSDIAHAGVYRVAGDRRAVLYIVPKMSLDSAGEQSLQSTLLSFVADNGFGGMIDDVVVVPTLDSFDPYPTDGTVLY